MKRKEKRKQRYQSMLAKASVNLAGVPQLDDDIAAKGDQTSAGDDMRAEPIIARAMSKLREKHIAELSAGDESRNPPAREARHQAIKSVRRRGY